MPVGKHEKTQARQSPSAHYYKEELVPSVIHLKNRLDKVYYEPRAVKEVSA